MRDIFLNNSKCLQYVPLLSWWLGYCQLCSDEEIWKHLLCFFFLDVAKKDEDTYSMIHSHKDQNQERYWRGWPASPLTALKVYGSKTSLTEQGTNPIYEKRVILFNKFCAFEPTRAYQEAEAKGAVEDNTVPCCQHEPFSFRHLPGGAHNALHMHWVETQPKLTWRLQICKLKWPLWKEDEADRKVDLKVHWQCWRCMGKVDQLDDEVRAEPADGVHVFEGSGVQQKSAVGVIVRQIDVLFACQGGTKNEGDYGDWNNKPNDNKKVMNRVVGHVLHRQNEEDTLHTCSRNETRSIWTYVAEPEVNQKSIQARWVRAPQSWQATLDLVICTGSSVSKSQQRWAKKSHTLRSLCTERLWPLLISCSVLRLFGNFLLQFFNPSVIIRQTTDKARQTWGDNMC